jgi:hypothetical protein
VKPEDARSVLQFATEKYESAVARFGLESDQALRAWIRVQSAQEIVNRSEGN